MLSGEFIGTKGRYAAENWPTQKSAVEFQELLDSTFAQGVTALTWHQYTPYFNDGDACVFRVSGEDEFLTVPYVHEEHYELVGAWGECEEPWQSTYSSTEVAPEGEPLRAIVDELGTIKVVYVLADQSITQIHKPVAAAKNFFKEINSKVYNNVLLENFGDPTYIVAVPGKFYLETFDHD